MTQGSNVALVAAAAGGYLLGRTKKGKVALGVAGWALGRKYGLTPTALVSQLARTLSESPEMARLTEQVRGELTEAGRLAFSRAVNGQFDSLADSLHERTQLLRGEVTESGNGESDEEDSGEDGSDSSEQSSKTQAPAEQVSSDSTETQPSPKTDKKPAGKSGGKRVSSGAQQSGTGR